MVTLSQRVHCLFRKTANNSFLDAEFDALKKKRLKTNHQTNYIVHTTLFTHIVQIFIFTCNLT